jgi:hypothetical protein
MKRLRPDTRLTKSRLDWLRRVCSGPGRQTYAGGLFVEGLFDSHFACKHHFYRIAGHVGSRACWISYFLRQTILV